jgi:hypothetical protein
MERARSVADDPEGVTEVGDTLKTRLDNDNIPVRYETQKMQFCMDPPTASLHDWRTR